MPPLTILLLAACGGQSDGPRAPPAAPAASCPQDCLATDRDDDGCCREGALSPSGPLSRAGVLVMPIPGGPSKLGCTPGAGKCTPDEKPPREVQMHSFEMMDREVSQGLWAAVMGFNPMEGRQRFSDGKEQGPCNVFEGEPLVGETLPVACIDWCDAVELANRLSLAERYTAAELAYSGMEQCRATAGASVKWSRGSKAWRLPTEQEWEHAARGRRDSQWGQADALNTNPCSLGNIADQDAKAKWKAKFREWGWETESCSDGVVGPSPVGSSRYPANAYGLRDMMGNVWEWTWDVYGPYPATSSSSYSGVDSVAGSSAIRVFRGGGWRFPARLARATLRVRDEPASRCVDLGLRLVRGSLAPSGVEP